MIEDFKALTEDEAKVMFDTPVMVTILIAGADNSIDEKELNKATSIARLKQNNSRRALSDYFTIVGETFESNLLDTLRAMPKDAGERNPIVIQHLEKLNTILPKLDKLFAIQFYASMKDMAKSIAEASGGVLGYMSVGYDEWKLIGLDMINDPS